MCFLRSTRKKLSSNNLQAQRDNKPVKVSEMQQRSRSGAEMGGRRQMKCEYLRVEASWLAAVNLSSLKKKL